MFSTIYLAVAAKAPRKVLGSSGGGGGGGASNSPSTSSAGKISLLIVSSNGPTLSRLSCALNGHLGFTAVLRLGRSMI